MTRKRALSIFGALNWVPKWYRSDGRYNAAEAAETFVRALTQGVAASAGRLFGQAGTGRRPGSLASV
jgi:hypothetical protein